MKIKIMGSGDEVGKSALLLETEKKIFLDFGVKIDPSPPKYPPFEKAEAVILSHAHLDHCGAIPLLFKKSKPKVFMNDLTMELTAMLIKDSMKVAKSEGFPTPFDKQHVKNMNHSTKLVRYNERFSVGNTQFSLWDSGHIPGSSSVLANTNGKSIFYTSDIQTQDSQLLRKCHLPKKADVLIIESTYGDRNHPDRKKLEAGFIEAVEETMANEETALIPAFAVGRAQEVALILERYADKIALDGMCKLASEIIEDYGYYLRDEKKFKSVMKRLHFVRNPKLREVALEKYPIIVSSAGMMGGGPVISYLREIAHRAGSSVIFTGFLGDDTPGRNLLDTNIFKNTEETFDVKCELRQFGLSAHTDRKGIFSIVEHLKPEKVICVHGDKCDKLAKDLEEFFKIEAFAPKNGEEIRL